MSVGINMAYAFPLHINIIPSARYIICVNKRSKRLEFQYLKHKKWTTGRQTPSDKHGIANSTRRLLKYEKRL